MTAPVMPPPNSSKLSPFETQGSVSARSLGRTWFSFQRFPLAPRPPHFPALDAARVAWFGISPPAATAAELWHGSNLRGAFKHRPTNKIFTHTSSLWQGERLSETKHGRGQSQTRAVCLLAPRITGLRGPAPPGWV